MSLRLPSMPASSITSTMQVFSCSRRRHNGLRSANGSQAPDPTLERKSGGGLKADPRLVRQADYLLRPKHRRELAKHAW